MRRSDREVTDRNEIVAIMEKCDVCRVAFNGGGYPYIVPMNFGLCVKEDVMELYFHGAIEGTKIGLMQKDNRVSFEMDCGHRLVPDRERGNCSMEYESVIGQGHMEILPEEEKEKALCILMRHYHQENFPFPPAILSRTKVFRLTVEKVTGKRCHILRKASAGNGDPDTSV